jgi:putative component of membrane protein insertase Oxa1/YidC/SpoIIIJ protein YidD
MVKGGVMTMDRLTRCNGLSPHNYEFDKTAMLLKDDPRITPTVPVVSTIK